MRLDLWKECEDLLSKYFVYDKIFDLLDYDADIQNLKKELTSLKKEEYNNNYRFIFLHYDTDVYLYQNMPGILLTNLQIILAELAIPNHFCLIVSNHNNLDSELETLRCNFTRDPRAISNICCQLQKCHVTNKLDPIDLNINNISKSYVCFNNTKRSHRHTLISMLQHSQLLDQGIVSYVS
jgi:hypothetical protein